MEAAEVLVPEVVDPEENPHRRNRRPPGETQRRIVELVNQGRSQTEIGAELGITQQAVGQAVKRARKNGALPPAPPSTKPPQLPAVKGDDLYEHLAGLERQGFEQARAILLPHIPSIVQEGIRLVREATPDDKEKVKAFDTWARVIFPTIKRNEHTGSGGTPLSILFKGINRGPQTVD